MLLLPRHPAVSQVQSHQPAAHAWQPPSFLARVVPAGGWTSEASCREWMGLGAGLEPISLTLFTRSNCSYLIEQCLDRVQAAFPSMVVTGQSTCRMPCARLCSLALPGCLASLVSWHKLWLPALTTISTWSKHGRENAKDRVLVLACKGCMGARAVALTRPDGAAEDQQAASAAWCWVQQGGPPARLANVEPRSFGGPGGFVRA